MRKMKRNQFKNMLKEKINHLAFKYLMEKRGKKGKEIDGNYNKRKTRNKLGLELCQAHLKLGV